MIPRLHSHVVKRSLRIGISVVAVLFLTGLVSFLVIRAFTIRSVIVDAPGMSIQLDPGRFGDNLLFLPTQSLRQELLASYPLLSDVRFEKKYPSSLIVRFVRRSAFAIVVSGNTLYAVDAQGLVLGVVSQREGYPELVFDVGTPSIGNVLTDDRILGSLSLLRKLSSFVTISRISEYNSQSLQAIMGNTNIFLPRYTDLSAKADTLQIIVEGFRIKGTLPTVIDLRYDKPIITNE